MKFKKCLNDPCPLMKENENGIIIICLYINDTLMCRERRGHKKVEIGNQEIFCHKRGGICYRICGMHDRKGHGRNLFTSIRPN